MDGLRIIDVSTPSSPQEVGFFDTDGEAFAVAVSGSFAYVADYRNGSRIIDISTPSSPQEVGFFDTGILAQGVAVSGNYVYVADGSDGMYIIQNDLLTSIDEESGYSPGNFLLEQNYPNPFNPETMIGYSLPIRSEVILTIYNIRGEEVALLINGTVPAGDHQVSWDASGFASGIYFYRLQADDFVRTRKMLLLK